jgi:hypothetical protein
MLQFLSDSLQAAKRDAKENRMRRHVFWLLLLIALAAITACRPESGPADLATEEPAATDDLGICPPDSEDCEDEETEVAAVPTSAPTAEPAPDQGAEETSPAPTSSAPAQPVDDPREIRDTDWVKGAEDPTITLIEYADYF